MVLSVSVRNRMYLPVKLLNCFRAPADIKPLVFVGGEYDNEYLCGMDIQETEKQILKIVKEKYDKTGGRNGNAFGDFDHLLNLPLTERNALLERMAAEKKIMVFNGPNYRMITLPK